jgi:KH domain-containing protein
MPETDYLKIPQNRVGALIGSNGSVKKSIEKATGTILDIDSDEGTVYITPREDMEDPLGVWNANHIVKAVARGFNPEVALKLVSDDIYLEVISLPLYIGKSKKALARHKGRIIGKDGKTREIIMEMAEVDMAGPYFYASIVCVAKTGSGAAQATGISQLAGYTCTAQASTIWYESCLPQIQGADIQTEAADASAMIMAVVSGTVDFICTDMPTAMGACAAYEGLTILDFTGMDDNFEVSEGEINIGISVKKGNTGLKDMIDQVLAGMTAADFNALMDQAIAVQPEV